MTDFNNNGKFVPSVPKTYEVRYIENKEPSKLAKLASYLGIKTVENCSYSGCPLPASVPCKVDINIEGINRKWARRTGNGSWLPGYWEPGNFDSNQLSRRSLIVNDVDQSRKVIPLLNHDSVYTINFWGRHCAEDTKFCKVSMDIIRKAISHHEGGNKVDEEIKLDSDISKWSRWGFKIAAGAGLTALTGPLGTAAVGGIIYGTGKIIENHPDANEYDKQISRSVSSFGGDIAKGGLIGSAAQTGGQLIGEIATGGSRVGGEVFKEFAKDVEGKIGYGMAGLFGGYHLTHQLSGKNYDPDCDVCNS